MSYCRWSSMNWMCDVYVYEDVSGGWTTHVAGARRTREPQPGDKLPKSHPASETEIKEWMESHRATMDDLENIPMEAIGLSHDGETFNDPTPGACADRLEVLRTEGYAVPDYAIATLRDEQAEMSVSGQEKS